MSLNDDEFGGERQERVIKKEGKTFTLYVSDGPGAAIDHNYRKEEGTSQYLRGGVDGEGRWRVNMGSTKC